MIDFNLDEFCRNNNISNGELDPYDFESYKIINPLLTESMYRKMREGGVLWKIKLGRKHIDKITGEVLENNKWIELLTKAKYSKL